jgi:hypothetical protein
MLSNFSLFAQTIWKVGWMTGVLPGFFVYEVLLLARALGWVPTRKLFGKVVSDEQIKISEGKRYFACGILRRAGWRWGSYASELQRNLMVLAKAVIVRISNCGESGHHGQPSLCSESKNKSSLAAGPLHNREAEFSHRLII